MSSLPTQSACQKYRCGRRGNTSPCNSQLERPVVPSYSVTNPFLGALLLLLNGSKRLFLDYSPGDLCHCSFVGSKQPEAYLFPTQSACQKYRGIRSGNTSPCNSWWGQPGATLSFLLAVTPSGPSQIGSSFFAQCSIVWSRAGGSIRPPASPSPSHLLHTTWLITPHQLRSNQSICICQVVMCLSRT